MTQDIEQRSDEWHAARCGSLGASQIADAISKSKDGKAFGSTSANLRAKLVVERLTGIQEDGFKTAAIQHGIDSEKTARLAYEAHTGAFVTEVGLYKHPTIECTHASPDGLVGDNGLIEIKCPNSATHIDTLKTEKVPTKYLYQMQWQMRCTDRQWCDYVSFDNRLKGSKMLFIKRVHRDDELIAKLECEVMAFLAMVQADMDKLNEMYPEDT